MPNYLTLNCVQWQGKKMWPCHVVLYRERKSTWSVTTAIHRLVVGVYLCMRRNVTINNFLQLSHMPTNP